MLADNLRWAPASVVGAADRLVELKKNKSPWEVIEAIVEMWTATNPTDWDSFLYDLEYKKQTSKVTSIGGTQFRGVSIDKSGTGGILRHRLDVPVKVIYMIRRLYPDMNMDKEFYVEWAKRFPKMMIEEVV